MSEKLVKEWIAKAEEDYKTILTLNRQKKHKLPNSICFHCQQCIEKYLKAFLVHNEFKPPRTLSEFFSRGKDFVDMSLACS